MAVAQQEVRKINSPYSEFCFMQLQLCVGYKAGKLASLFQLRLGLGCLNDKLASVLKVPQTPFWSQREHDVLVLSAVMMPRPSYRYSRVTSCFVSERPVPYQPLYSSVLSPMNLSFLDWVFTNLF